MEQVAPVKVVVTGRSEEKGLMAAEEARVMALVALRRSERSHTKEQVLLRALATAVLKKGDVLDPVAYLGKMAADLEEMPLGAGSKEAFVSQVARRLRARGAPRAGELVLGEEMLKGWEVCKVGEVVWCQGCGKQFKDRGREVAREYVELVVEEDGQAADAEWSRGVLEGWLRGGPGPDPSAEGCRDCQKGKKRSGKGERVVEARNGMVVWCRAQPGRARKWRCPEEIVVGGVKLQLVAILWQEHRRELATAEAALVKLNTGEWMRPGQGALEQKIYDGLEGCLDGQGEGEAAPEAVPLLWVYLPAEAT